MTVKRLASLDTYYWLSESAIRHLIFQSQPRINSRGETIPGNGLAEAGAIVRIGRKILIELNAFDKWVESKNCSNELL